MPSVIKSSLKQLEQDTLLREKICQIIEAGNYPSTAFMIAGLTGRMYGEVRDAAAQGVEWAQDFMKEMIAAEGRAEERLVGYWEKRTAVDWQAARDFLARRWPERWNRQPTTKIEATVKQQKAIDLKQLSDEELEQLEGLIAAAQKANEANGNNNNRPSEGDDIYNTGFTGFRPDEE